MKIPYFSDGTLQGNETLATYELGFCPKFTGTKIGSQFCRRCRYQKDSECTYGTKKTKTE